MKKIYVLGVMSAFIFNVDVASAIMCSPIDDIDGWGDEMCMYVNDDHGCKSGIDIAYGDMDSDVCYVIRDCFECESDMQLVTVSDNFSDHFLLGDCLNVGVISWHECQPICSECANCHSDTSWNNVSTGYQSKATRTCICGDCNVSYEYRCADGYWGTTTNGISGCTMCPVLDDKVAIKTYGVSIAGNNRDITSCYLKPGNYNDYTGGFSVSSNCGYSK